MTTYTQEVPGKAKGSLRTIAKRVNGSTASESTANVSLSFLNTVTKGTNPKWRQDVIANRNATTVLSGVRYVVHSYQPGSIQVTNPNAVYPTSVKSEKWTGMMIADHAISPPETASIDVTKSDNAAKSHFLRDLTSAQSRLQGMVAVGEIGRTLSMLRNPALSLRRGLDDYFTSVKKRTRRAPRRSWNNIAGNSWLEYNFGWSQLYRDTIAANDALHQIRESDYAREVLRGFGEETAQTENGYLEASSGLVALLCSRHSNRRAQTIYRGATRAVPTDPRYMPARTLGFSFQEFVPTVWELIPYSFLVDYFTNVGDVIKGWSWQTSGLAWCNRTYRRSRFRTLVTSPNIPMMNQNSGKVDSFSPSISVIERTQVDRSKYTGKFIPSITFELPTSRKISKLLNVAGLLAIRRL